MSVPLLFGCIHLYIVSMKEVSIWTDTAPRVNDYPNSNIRHERPSFQLLFRIQETQNIPNCCHYPWSPHEKGEGNSQVLETPWTTEIWRRGYWVGTDLKVPPRRPAFMVAESTILASKGQALPIHASYKPQQWLMKHTQRVHIVVGEID